MQVSNLLIARFSLILLLCIASNVFFTAPWQLRGLWDMIDDLCLFEIYVGQKEFTDDDVPGI